MCESTTILVIVILTIEGFTRKFGSKMPKQLLCLFYHLDLIKCNISPPSVCYHTMVVKITIHGRVYIVVHVKYYLGHNIFRPVIKYNLEGNTTSYICFNLLNTSSHCKQSSHSSMTHYEPLVPRKHFFNIF